MNVSPSWRRTLPVVLVVFCQLTLALHYGWHIAPDTAHCVACQAHTPQAGDTLADNPVPQPVIILLALLPLERFIPQGGQPPFTNRARAPPPALS